MNHREVEPGQVWASCDPRDGDRGELIVDRVQVWPAADPFAVLENRLTGRRTSVKLRRMRPWSNGYRRVR